MCHNAGEQVGAPTPPWGARVIYRLGHEAAGGGVFVTIQFNTTGAAGWWITCLPLLKLVCHSSVSEPHSLSLACFDLSTDLMCSPAVPALIVILSCLTKITPINMAAKSEGGFMYDRSNNDYWPQLFVFVSSAFDMFYVYGNPLFTFFVLGVPL